MTIQLIKIGNSRGFRIPRAVLEQCGEAEEFTLDIDGGKIMLTPLVKKEYDMKFNNIEKMSDSEIRDMLRKIHPFTLAVSLIDSSQAVRKRIKANMSPRAWKILGEETKRLKDLDARELIVEMHRAKINEAFTLEA